MEIEKLRKIIYEEVRKAMQTEIRDILVEAVEIASTPTHITKPVQIKEDRSYGIGLAEMLQDTATSMTREDYANMVISEPVERPVISTAPRSDSSIGKGLAKGTNPDTMRLPNELPDFVSRAGKVFEASKTVVKDPNVQSLVEFEESPTTFSEDMLMD